MLANSWTWSLPWRVLIHPVALHWRKLTSWLGVGLCVRFPFLVLVLHLSWTHVGLVHAAQPLWVRINAVVSRRNCFLGVICHLWLFPSSHLLFRYILSLEGMGLIKTSHLGRKLLKFDGWRGGIDRVISSAASTKLVTSSLLGDSGKRGWTQIPKRIPPPHVQSNFSI